MTFLVKITGRNKNVSFLGDGSMTLSSSSQHKISEARLFIPRHSIAWDEDILREEGGFTVEIATSAGLFSGIGGQPVPTDYGAEVLVYGPHRWLEQRVVGSNRVFRRVTAATVAREAIKDGLIGLAAVPIGHGTYLQQGPLVREVIFDGQSVMDVLQQLMAETGQMFRIDERMRFHWCAQIGRYHPQWYFDDGKLLRDLQPLPLLDRIGEHIQLEPSGRRFSVRREAQPILWPSQRIEST